MFDLISMDNGVRGDFAEILRIPNRNYDYIFTVILKFDDSGKNGELRT